MVEHERVAVEDQLVLAADEVAEGDGGEVVARALDEHPLALQRPCRAWYGDADALTISGAPASASSEAGGPGVQMSSQIVSPMRGLAELDHRAALAGLEVALLVEDAVVGQVALAVDGRRRGPSARTASAL